jgi:hypothetical protein
MVEQQTFQFENGGLIPASPLQNCKIDYIKPISLEQCFRVVEKYHYSKIKPRLTKICLGGFKDDKLVAVISLGWGVRPLHTIKKLFSDFTTKDYYEIGKMCVIDEMPKNTESVFLSLVILWLKKHTPCIKVLFTWADGIMGKPGYVYQASNFMYGGFICTDVYFTKDGEKVHPRTTGKIGGRPTKEFLEKYEWTHVKGKQFRYIYPLHKGILKKSLWDWSNKNYPKGKDLEWKMWTRELGWVKCARPFYNREQNYFNKNKLKQALFTLIKDNARVKLVADDINLPLKG